MELRQLRYLVRVIELGSISRAALDMDLVQSALSQQISRLEGELSTRLLQRSSKGVVPTEAGLAFFREAQLVAPCRASSACGQAGAPDGKCQRGNGPHHRRRAGSAADSGDA